LSGGKAAALAQAASAGLPMLPGVVLTTAFSDDVDAGADIESIAAVADAVERAGGGTQALVARSSAVAETRQFRGWLEDWTIDHLRQPDVSRGALVL
jgi:hypothetical protein